MKYEIVRSRFTILFQSVYKIAKENENMGPEIRVFENSQLPPLCSYAHTRYKSLYKASLHSQYVRVYEYVS